ncbi:trihelix transcription factor ENAP1 [Gastrolobium bilobum]|uniref:trihelix transcription factor ENAP1 n=1 Tax=Gastrolobium bilobum TaxID=150636 RepID=UPI002AB06FBB|nr:trihelix transcription factor ENAP1 [Gastrolobium bilobum]XP_061366482.1 trihelix transcription factor ENAP1 [Gastrolobium bilobum]
MDDMEDDARYPPKSFSLHRQNPSHRQKHPIRGAPYHQRPVATRYEEVDDEEDEEAEEYDDYDDENDAGEDEEVENANGYGGNFEEDDGFGRSNTRKRKVRGSSSGISNYEFAPRVKFSYGNNRGGSEEWTEEATFVLLEVWGDKFLQLGRNSLRSEEWKDVAEKVSEELEVERTVAQCRSMLDKLKRRYKKEKARMDEMGVSSCKWAYFKKMDMLMASSARQEYGLACGVDSGEYVFMNTRVYLNRSNEFDEMRDSPVESETSDENDSDGVATAPRRSGGGGGGADDDEDEEEETSFRVLADSIQKFGKIYEKIENSKRQQMMELEKMRLDFNRELELQKKQILERAQAEITKIQEGDEDDQDTSAENLSE